MKLALINTKYENKYSKIKIRMIPLTRRDKDTLLIDINNVALLKFKHKLLQT